MGWSIVTYSGWTALSYYAQTPEQLWGLRFLACLGVGGMWPSGVALAAEAWPQTARPVLAGLIGTAANVGFLVLGLIMWKHPVTQASWRWVMLLGGAPLLLAPIVFWTVAESPRWLETRRAAPPEAKRVPVWVILQAPLLRRTALGVALGTIPMLGGWASGQRLVPWAGQVAEQAARPQLQGHTQIVFAAGAVAGSLIGGWIAHRLGPRLSYFLLSLGSLVLSVGIFVGLRPGHDLFLWAACLLGAVSTSYFGWLPYFLPDLFPTSVRATGTGTAYNLGRLVSAAAVLASAGLSAVFAGDIGRMGAATSWVYALGLVLAWMVPAGGVRPLDETSGERKGLREGATK
jgi:MFS family permease